jgi:hypothetical protein
MHIRMYACMYIRVHVNAWSSRPASAACMYVCVSVYTQHGCTFMYVCVHIGACMYDVYTYSHTHTCGHEDTHTHTYTPTHPHVHSHTYTPTHAAPAHACQAARTRCEWRRLKLWNCCSPFLFFSEPCQLPCRALCF